jgi:hypothetical protein
VSGANSGANYALSRTPGRLPLVNSKALAPSLPVASLFRAAHDCSIDSVIAASKIRSRQWKALTHVLALNFLSRIGALALGEVQKLPLEVQTDIAKRVDIYLNVARAANKEAILATVASSAIQEQAKAMGEGGTMDPRWAAPAIAEAWCYATMSLSKGYLDQLHAQAIIGAIEAFTLSRLNR